MPNIDERLLAGKTLRPEEEGEAAEELKNRRNGGEKEENQGGSLRQRVQAARQAMDLKAKAKQKLEEKVTAPARMATNRALQWAWGVLIPSFGLSLIYINTHVFLRWVFPSAFCKLGDEWMPKMVGTGEHTSKNVAGTAFGIVEIMGLLFLDLLAFLIILSIITIIVWIADSFIFKIWSATAKAWEWIFVWN